MHRRAPTWVLRCSPRVTRRARGRPLDQLIPIGLDGLRALLESFIAEGFSKFIVRPLDSAR